MSEPAGLIGREAVAAALAEMRQELQAGVEWENESLERYLEALEALLESVENCYINEGVAVPLNPWEIMASALKWARDYE